MDQFRLFLFSLFKLLYRIQHIGLSDDVVPLEHTPSFPTSNAHDHGLADSEASVVARRRPPQIVEQETDIFEISCLAGIAPLFYWKNRLEGIPVPLALGEGAQMAEWAIYLGPVFPEAVEKLLLTPIPDLQNSFMLTELSESDLRKQYPKAATSLVLYVLKNAQALPWDTRWIEPLITELAAPVESKSIIRLACDELARLGRADAPRLKGLAS